MSEYLMPMKHTGGDGIFICAGFSGLEEETYEKLEISIDGGEYQTVDRDPDVPIRSLPYSFSVEATNHVHPIRGIITTKNGQKTIETKMVSMKYDAVKTAPLKVQKAARLMSLNAVSGKPAHASGCMAAPPPSLMPERE